MMTLFYEKFLGVDWSNFSSSVMALLWGVLLGAIFTVFFYALATLASLRKSRYVMDKRVKQVDTAEVQAIIKDAQDQYLLQKSAKDPEEKYMTKIVMHEVESIAALYYPKSKRPMAELTIDELILLARYITETMDKILSRRALKMFKRMKLSTILNLADIKNNKAVKTAEKYKVGKVAKYATMAINAINPFYWFKKAVIDTSFSLITKKLYLIVLAIIGEQTNKVFSREALVEMEDQFDAVLKEIESQMNSYTEDGEIPEVPDVPKKEEEFELTKEENKMIQKERKRKEKEEKRLAKLEAKEAKKED